MQQNTPASDDQAQPDGGTVRPHLSQVVVRGPIAFVSGHVPLDELGNLVGDDALTQAREVLRGLERTLGSEGFDLADVVSTTVYLTSTKDFGAVNSAFQQFFPEAPPTRSTVQVGLMSPEFKVEIDAIAYKNRSGNRR